jgi:hypothetical protein
MTATEVLLGSLLRDQSRCPGEVPPPGDPRQFLQAARLHGVTSLLDERLARLPNRSAWPAEILDACREAAIEGVAREVLQHRELLRVLEGFAMAGVEPLLLKGAVLAYTHYPRPALRPRGDTDLLVPDSCVAAAEGALGELGYARNPGVSGAYIAYQSSWTGRDGSGMSHHVDLHRRVNNAQVLARALDCAELAARAVRVEALGPHARAPAPAHALLLACMHRAGHMADPHQSAEAGHPGGDRLIWLYDMHLLVSRMAAAELDGFAELAVAKSMTAICRDALEHAARLIGTRIPDRVLARLAEGAAFEPSARLLDGRPASRMIGDFAAIEGAAGRARWLRELAFPSPAHMRRKYAGARFGWLPWLYARRAAGGLWRLLVPRRRGPAD